MSNPLYQRHVISIADLTRHDLETVIATAQQLKREPRTDLLKDFVSSRTNRKFSAFLVRNAEGKVGFEFEKREPKAKAGAKPAAKKPAAKKA